MGFSGGGSNVTKAHTHSSSIVQDGGALNFSNVTQAGMAAGDITYSNGTALQILNLGSATDTLTVNSGATAPEWATASAAGVYSKLGTDSSTSGAATLTVGSFTATDVMQVYFYGCSASTTEDDIQITLNSSSANYSQRGVYAEFAEVDFQNQSFWSATMGNNTPQRPFTIKITMWKQNSNIIGDAKVQGFLKSANSWTDAEQSPAGVNTYSSSGIIWNDTAAVTGVTIKHGSDNIIGNLQVNGFDYG